MRSRTQRGQPNDMQLRGLNYVPRQWIAHLGAIDSAWFTNARVVTVSLPLLISMYVSCCTVSAAILKWVRLLRLPIWITTLLERVLLFLLPVAPIPTQDPTSKRTWDYNTNRSFLLNSECVLVPPCFPPLIHPLQESLKSLTQSMLEPGKEYSAQNKKKWESFVQKVSKIVPLLYFWQPHSQ